MCGGILILLNHNIFASRMSAGLHNPDLRFNFGVRPMVLQEAVRRGEIFNLTTTGTSIYTSPR